jgi:1-acyl-sn-glycerol-3-phosphate acyltransferase
LTLDKAFLNFRRALKRKMGFRWGGRRNPLVYGFTKIIAAIVFHLCYRLHIQGMENIPGHGPAVILPKHQYWTDIPIVGLALRPQLNYVAKTELFKFRFVKAFLSLLGGIPVDREKTTKTMGSFRYIQQLLRGKEYLVIFPEGTYYRGEVGKGKSRLIQMILRWQDNREIEERRSGNHHIPFVPVGIHYGRKGLRKTVNVIIGRPIFAEATGAPRLTSQIIESIGLLSGLPREGTEMQDNGNFRA